MGEKPTSSLERRNFLRIIGSGVLGLVLGTALGYTLAPTKERVVIETAPTTTTTQTVTRRLPKDTIKIGVLGIRTGVWAAYGTYIEQGARLAAEEINNSGGILGSKVELVIRDEAADVIKQARELVEQENVDFIVGVDSSGNVIKLAAIMPELNKLLIVTHAATHRLTEEFVAQDKKKYGMIFRISVPVYQDGILGAWVASQLPVSKWAGLNPDYEYGRVSWELFKTVLKALRPDVEFVTELYNPSPGTVDFTKWISAIMSTDAEALYTANWSGEAITLHKQAIQLGLYKKLKAVINPLGYAADVAYGLGKDYPTLPNGMWVSGRYLWFYPPTAVNKRFVDAFINKWGKLPSYSAETTYTAIYVIKTAIEKTGTLDLDSLIATIENMVILSPAGVRWIRPEDHQAVYEVPFGEITNKYVNIGGDVPLLANLKVLPAYLYYRTPPDYKIPLISE